MTTTVQKRNDSDRKSFGSPVIALKERTVLGQLESAQRLDGFALDREIRAAVGCELGTENG